MSELKPYVVKIEEVSQCNVIIWAKDVASAATRAEELLDSGDINMEQNGYRDRIAVTCGVAVEAELEEYDQYGRDSE